MNANMRRRAALRRTDAPSLVGQPAGFVSRLLALVIDVVLLSLTIMTGNLLLTALSLSGPVPWATERLLAVIPTLRPWFDTGTALLPVLLGLGTVVGYFLFFFTITGQTLGKRLLGLQVVSAQGGDISFWQAALRLVGYTVSTVPLYLGFLAALLDRRGRAWHDRIAGTQVIYVWDARPDERFLRPPR